MMKGHVIKRVKGFYKILDENGNVCDCKIKGNLFRYSKYDNQPAPGDLVDFTPALKGIYGLISKINERQNTFSRKRVEGGDIQVIAANIDQIFIFSSFTQPEFRKNLVLRMAVSAISQKIEPVILLNKRDLADKDKQEKIFKLLDSFDLKYHSHSNFIESDRQKILELIKNKKTLLSGHSGVGKSSLIKIILPDQEIRINEIAAKNKKGRHITTLAEVYLIDQKTWITDTPGIREFEPPLLSKADLANYFPLLLKYHGRCKYRDCLHESEPDCHIKDKLKEGVISPELYDSYLEILATFDDR